MLHLLFLEYTNGEHAAAPHIAAPVAYPERHHSADTFLLSDQTVPTSMGGVIIAHGADRAEAERITPEDPFIHSGVARYRTTTVDPGRTHPPWPPDQRRPPTRITLENEKGPAVTAGPFTMKSPAVSYSPT
ncbi:YciI family protein, partial [Actinomadura yumaensis]